MSHTLSPLATRDSRAGGFNALPAMPPTPVAGTKEPREITGGHGGRRRTQDVPMLVPAFLQNPWGPPAWKRPGAGRAGLHARRSHAFSRLSSNSVGDVLRACGQAPAGEACTQHVPMPFKDFLQNLCGGRPACKRPSAGRQGLHAFNEIVLGNQKKKGRGQGWKIVGFNKVLLGNQKKKGPGAAKG